MSFSVQDSGRVGQSAYWAYFGANMILVPILFFGGLYEIASGGWGTGALCIMLVLPLGIYFRVIMMRRCRDIGWPAFLPWVMLGLGILTNMMVMSRITANPTEATSALIMPAIVTIADFAIMIVIGCLATKDQHPDFGGDYESLYQPIDRPAAGGTDPGFDAGPIDSVTSESDRWDAAIARRLAAQQSSPCEAAPAEHGAEPYPQVQRAATGFGRRVI
jgi:uncharacterized membrane protein YhaH (DUF805 family)